MGLADFDALIAGGGPAGCAAAAALSAIGLKILLVDAGVDKTKQLAGELLHPAGVQDLEALGLASGLRTEGCQPILGFAVVDHRRDHTAFQLLPYGAEDRGLAMEHALLTRSLLTAVEGRASVELWRGSKVARVVRNDVQAVEVEVSREGTRNERIRARMLVAADGRSSPIRGQLGIGENRQRLSTMLGVLVEAGRLPYPGYGHLFIGGPAPVLAYAITAEKARVMVDLPAGTGLDALLKSPELLDGLPAPLREEVLRAAREGSHLMAANETRLPTAVAAQCGVLVGDAAGCCHPLSASGMASATRDALVLQGALRQFREDVPSALRRYARQRRAPQRTRIALASALYRTFSERTPEMAALRAGLFRYWQKSPRGCEVSMALLSTREWRMSVMTREYARAVGYALIPLIRGGPQQAPSPHRARAELGLAGSIAPHLRSMMRGALERLR